MRNPGFPTFCALGIFLCLLPLPWHWKAKNTSTLLYIAWIELGCITLLVNSLVWAGNTNLSTVWCNISIRIQLGLSVGMPAASLCINRRLYNIATVKYVSYNDSSKRRDLIIDLMLYIVLPMIVMVLEYIIATNQYNVVEDIGCIAPLDTSLLSVSNLLIWPVIVSTASLIYASLTIRAFIKTRRQFSRVLSDSASGLNMSRYFRLMALATTEIFFSLPLSMFFLVAEITVWGTTPWISVERLHWHFSDIGIISYEEWQTTPRLLRVGTDIQRWIIPGGAFLFFMFFGLSKEATEEYKRILQLVVTPFGLGHSAPKPNNDPQPSRLDLPTPSLSVAMSSNHSTANIVIVPNNRFEPKLVGRDNAEIDVKDIES